MEVDWSKAWVRAILGAIAGIVCLQLGMSLAGSLAEGRIVIAPIESGSQWLPLILGAIIGGVVWARHLPAIFSGLLLGLAWTLPLVVHLWQYIVKENPWVYVRLLGFHFVAVVLAGMLLGKLISIWHVPEEGERRPARRTTAHRHS